MLTPKTPACATARPVSLVLFRQTRIMGGSIDSEETALAVVPKGAPLAVVVMTVTPLAKRPITSRNTCCSTTASSGRSVLSLLVTGNLRPFLKGFGHGAAGRSARAQGRA